MIKIAENLQERGKMVMNKKRIPNEQTQDDFMYETYGLSPFALEAIKSKDDIVIKKGDTVSYLGDISFADNKCVAMKYDSRQKGLEGIVSKEIIEYLQEKALVIANAEFAVGVGGEPLERKKYTYKAEPTRLPMFHDLNVELVTLANNHVCDFGMDIFQQTIDSYDKYKIKRIGAGKNIEEAAKAQYYSINGYKFAFINANRSEKVRYTPEATEQHPGVFMCYDSQLLEQAIKKEKKSADFVILLVHWGKENSNEIQEILLETSRIYIDAGADAIIGHHAHMLQGIEYYKGKPIFYNIGNFIFSYIRAFGAVITMKVNDNKTLEWSFVPILQKDTKVRFLDDLEKERIIEEVNSWNRNARIEENGRVVVAEGILPKVISDSISKSEDIRSKTKSWKNSQKGCKGTSRTSQLVKIEELVDEESLYPTMERKSREERVQDNIKWVDETGYVNALYNMFGLDVKNFRNQEDFLERWIWHGKRKLKHHGNMLPSTSGIITKNKFLFYAYLESICKGIVPKTYYLIDSKKVYAPLGETGDVLTVIKTLPTGVYICKESGGAYGASIMKIQIQDGTLVINHGNMDEEEFLARIGNKKHLIQEYVQQHESLGKYNPSTLNTVRIVTTRYGNKAHFLVAAIRFGDGAEKIVDNLSQGGLYCTVNEKGEFGKYGYYYDKPRVLEHPTTGIKFAGEIVPYWKEVLHLVIGLHEFIPGLLEIGWDVAITPISPMVIEANNNFGTKMLQMSSGGLKKKLEENKLK